MPSRAVSDEEVAPIRKNKENRAPNSSKSKQMSDDEVSGATKSSKQQQSKQKKGASASTTATQGKKSKKSVESEVEEEEQEEEEADAEAVESSEDEAMEVEPEVKKRGRKPAVSKAASKSIALESEESEMTAREKILKAKLEAKNDALKLAHETFLKLKNMRTTHAEEAVTKLTELAAERQTVSFATIQSYKAENDTLRAQLAELHVAPNLSASTSTRPALPSSPPKVSRIEDTQRIEKLTADRAALKSDVQRLKSEAASMKEKYEKSERAKVQERDQTWEHQIEVTAKAKDAEAAKVIAELKRDLAIVTSELKAEVEHSKSLSKSKGSASGPRVGGDLAHAKVVEELEDLKMRLHLNEDCTGLMVHSFKRDELVGDTYGCVLNDLLQKAGALPFSLTFNKDRSMSYTPQCEDKRDEQVMALLPEHFKAYMRFDSAMTGQWFRELYKAINAIA